MKHTIHTLKLRDGLVEVKFWYEPAYITRNPEYSTEETFEWEIKSTTVDFSEEDWCDEDDEEILEQLRQIVIDQEDGVYYDC